METTRYVATLMGLVGAISLGPALAQDSAPVEKTLAADADSDAENARARTRDSLPLVTGSRSNRIQNIVQQAPDAPGTAVVDDLPRADVDAVTPTPQQRSERLRKAVSSAAKSSNASGEYVSMLQDEGD